MEAKTKETEFRTWLKTNYGIQDFEAYKGTQTEEIAIQYSSALSERVRELEELLALHESVLSKVRKEQP